VITLEGLGVQSLFSHIGKSEHMGQVHNEGYQVDVEVTGGRKTENAYSHNVKLPSAITSVL